MYDNILLNDSSKGVNEQQQQQQQHEAGKMAQWVKPLTAEFELQNSHREKRRFLKIILSSPHVYTRTNSIDM